MKGILNKAFVKVKVGLLRRVVICMRETGEMIKQMERACRNGVTGNITMETLLMIIDTVMAFILTKMTLSTKGNGFKG